MSDRQGLCRGCGIVFDGASLCAGCVPLHRYCFDCEAVLWRTDAPLCMTCESHRADGHLPAAMDTIGVELAPGLWRSELLKPPEWCHGAGPFGTTAKRLTHEPYPLRYSDTSAGIIAGAARI